MNKDTDNSQDQNKKTIETKPVDSNHLLVEHNKSNKSAHIALIVILTLCLLAGVFYFASNSKNEDTSNNLNNNDRNNTSSEQEDSGDPISELKGDQKISSSLGFVVYYDANAYDAYAETTDHTPKSPQYSVTGVTYEASETVEARDYSIVSLKFKGSDDTRDDFSLVTNIRATYWDKKVVLPENEGKSKLDIYVAETIASVTDNAGGQTISAPEPATVGKNQFMKVTETFTNPANKDLVTEYVYYLTVVNDRPYRVTLTVEKDKNYDKNMAKLEQVLAGVEFAGLDTTKLAP